MKSGDTLSKVAQTIVATIGFILILLLIGTLYSVSKTLFYVVFSLFMVYIVISYCKDKFERLERKIEELKENE